MLIVLHHPILQTGTLRHRQQGEPPQVPLRGRARIQLRRCWFQRGASSPCASLSPHPPPTSPVWATLSPDKAFHLGHTPAALILTWWWWWGGVQAVHLGFSAAPPATAESPKVGPRGACWAPSLLYLRLSPSISWGPRVLLGTPLLLAPWLLSHSQLCFSLWFINRLDVLPFSVAQSVPLCYSVSLLFFLIYFFIEG